MTTTLKLDWKYNRIEAVSRWLSAYRPASPAQHELRTIVDGASPEDTFTLKLEWGPDLIRNVIVSLERAASAIETRIDSVRSGEGKDDYAYLVQDQAQIHAARREIVEYLASAELARRTNESLLKGTPWEGNPNIIVRNGVVHDKRYDR